MVKAANYEIQGYRAEADLHVVKLDLGTIIFCNTWLANVNPAIDWKEKTMTITDGDLEYRLDAREDRKMEVISVRQLQLIMADEAQFVEERTKVYPISIQPHFKGIEDEPSG